MYMALRLLNLHLQSALLQFNFTSCAKFKKINFVPTEAQKNLKPPRVY
jgi:hypothetical protein